MLIEFRVSNFRSFKEEQTLSMVAAKDKNHPGGVTDCGKFKLLNAAAIYGANASGKSNLMSAMLFVQKFVNESARRGPQAQIPMVDPFRLDSKTAEGPSSFQVTIRLEDTDYEYGFSVDSERVWAEWLNVYPPSPKRRRQWLKRTFNPAESTYDWTFRRTLRHDSKLLSSRTRDNCLVLSQGANLNVEALGAVFSSFSDRRLRCLDMSSDATALLQETARMISKDLKTRDLIARMLRDADTHVKSIEPFRRLPSSLVYEHVPQRLVEQLQALLTENAGDGEVASFGVKTHHASSSSGTNVDFDLQEHESRGTQRYFAILGPILEALGSGATVVVDELECSLHPLLAKKLVALFQSKEHNKKGAQLVFATHNTELMDPELLRRDQIWFIEKNKDEASQLYSLHDFKRGRGSRSGSAFARNYLAGRYGAVPNFGPLFEELETE